MKERPILFSAPMVRALLNGTKTQTRRVVKLAKGWSRPPPSVEEAHQRYGKPGMFILEAGFFGAKCQYGHPGDRLWVRETWGFAKPVMEHDEQSGRSYVCDWRDWTGKLPDKKPDSYSILYRADDDWEDVDSPEERGFVWRPSIFTKRWASRITLEITDVRVQRLQDISEADAISEGIERTTNIGVCRALGWRGAPGLSEHMRASHAYGDLWESINGEDSWLANPWVWALTFKLVTQ